jgi:iron(III) transport system ATP-binding protein
LRRRGESIRYSVTMTAITIQGLTKKFANTTAVDHVNLEIKAGELFFLLGPSGCGKTTLLRMIAGFVMPTDGAIFFGDQNVTRTPPNKRNTGMVFQSYALWPHMTVFENVAFGLRVRKFRDPELSSRVMSALRSVRMEDFAQRKPNELSGGQQQRAALARALVIQPTVLLLDEPLSNLDAKLRLEMRSEIKRICKLTGITTIYVTHDQKEALSMADNVAVMRRGQVVQVGPPRELYERPATRFVADFLGESNFISGVTELGPAGEIMVKTDVGMIAPPRTANADGGGARPQLAPGVSVTCSIRPEGIQIKPLADEAPNILRGTCQEAIYLGDTAQLLVELPDGRAIKVQQSSPHHICKPGEAVSLKIEADSIAIIAE